jgi:hypothetical protein
MKPMTPKVVTMMALALLFAMSTQGQERHLKKSDLPAAVQKTAAEQGRGATVRGYASEVEDGKLQYEVELMVSGHSKDVTIAPDGSVLEVEEQVALESLSAPVREALQEKAGAGTITKVESLTKGGRLVAYEAQVRTQGKRSEIQVGPEGKALEHPE